MRTNAGDTECSRWCFRVRSRLQIPVRVDGKWSLGFGRSWKTSPETSQARELHSHSHSGPRREHLQLTDMLQLVTVFYLKWGMHWKKKLHHPRAHGHICYCMNNSTHYFTTYSSVLYTKDHFPQGTMIIYLHLWYHWAVRLWAESLTVIQPLAKWMESAVLEDVHSCSVV